MARKPKRFKFHSQTIFLIILLGTSYLFFATPSIAIDNKKIIQPDTSQWQADILDWEHSPVNLSFLNADERPAGKRGFVKAEGEQLVFEDGTVAKFWGVNIAAYTVFQTTKENTKQQAKKLAKMGFNLVRIHHIDSPWVEPNIFASKETGNTRKVSASAMDKLDWWVKCLKDEGIYVWLDLHVQRHFRRGDRITDFAEISKGKAEVGLKGYHYVNASMQQAMQAFNTAYLTHKNPYTGTKYTEEPAIIAALLTNENDITNHFGNALLPNKNVAAHSKRYMQLASDFAAKNNLNKNKIWQAWEHGPSKIFLNDLEHQFNVKATAHLRKLGFQALIATTSFWGNSALNSLPALTSGDIIDVHAYLGAGTLSTNPLHAENLTHWLATAQVVGKPLTVSEWNADSLSAEDRHVLPMYVAVQSSFQGWDALMHYAYSQSGAGAPQKWSTPSSWNSMYDPSIMATMPAAALMYRRGDVKEAANTYVLKLDADLFNKGITPKNSVFIRTATELGKLQIAMSENKALPWLEKSALLKGAKVFNNPKQSLLKSGAVGIENTDFKRDWQQGNLVINTSKTQGIVGAFSGKKISLKNIEITSKTPNLAVIVQSLNTSSIEDSENILISLSARSITSPGNKFPFLSELVQGQIVVNAMKGLKLYKRMQSQKEQQVPMQYQDGKYTITLDKTLKTYWLSLRKPNATSSL